MRQMMSKLYFGWLLWMGLALVSLWGQTDPVPVPADPKPTPTQANPIDDPASKPTAPVTTQTEPDNPSDPKTPQDQPISEEPVPIPIDSVDSVSQPHLPSADPPDGLPALTNLAPVVDYHIQVKLFPQEKRLTGTVRLIYTNHSPDIIPDLRWHTYLNAFKNNLSTYAIESGETSGLSDKKRSYIHISKATVDGVDLTETMAYYQGPNSAAGDQTVLRIPLQGPLMPGQSTTVILDFEAKIPQAMERTGYVDNFFFLAQWFPKVGVWESRGTRGAKVAGWNCHPYHANTEYFADFGKYRVAITVPAHYEVGATGVLQGEEMVNDEKTFTFEQDRIHDFAIVAAEALLRHERVFDPVSHISEVDYQEAMALYGLNREQVVLKPVKMIFLYPADQQPNIDRYFTALEVGLKNFGLWFGAYPYETITMLNPPSLGGRPIGGMEYPNLITLSYRRKRLANNYDLEDLILHEFAHQYFYGLVANNEFEEAYLDEGFSTYISSKLTDSHFGGWAMSRKMLGYRWPVSDWLGFSRYSSIDEYWRTQRSNSFQEPIAKPGWTFYSSNYYRNSYSKSALALEQLERELGSDTFAIALRRYVSRFSFRHPSLADFQVVVEEVAQRDMTWFFERVFHQIGKVDYEALPVRKYDIRLNEGYVDSPTGPLLQDSSEEAKNRQRQEVTVINHGSLVYPVTVAVTFENGDVLNETFDGEGRWARFSYDDAPKIIKVEVDPQGLIVLDPNPTNNSYVVDPDPKWDKSIRDRLTLGVQHFLQTLAWGL